jgi:hypothetical protein
MLPAAAQAAAPSATSVAKRVQKAQGQTARTAKLAASHDAAVTGALRSARRQVTTAAREARALAAAARTSRQRLNAAWALALVAGRLSQDAGVFAAAVGNAAPATQPALAAAVPGSVNSLDTVLALLNQISGGLSAADQAKVQEAIAAVLAKLPATIGAVAGAAGAPGVPVSISAILEHALAAATSALNQAIEKIKASMASLPAEAQGPLGTALTLIQAQLPKITGIVQQISTMIAKQIDSIIGMVTQVLGGLVPGSSSATGSATSGGGLFGLFPAFSGLFQKLLGSPGALPGSH